jgi:hypothetical protein
MQDATDSAGISGSYILRFLSICTLAVATICMTLPAPEALADSGQQILLAQAYPPPPAYPPSSPPPPGYGQPPPGYPPPGYGPPPGANEAAQAQIDGRADAAANISGVLWFFAGFFLSWIGIILGYVLNPSPDGARLIGKSPGYVSAYTDAYQSEGRSFQGIHAVYGCVTSGVIYIVIIVLYYALVACAVATVD